jgi:hypothetical protein
MTVTGELGFLDVARVRRAEQPLFAGIGIDDHEPHRQGVRGGHSENAQAIDILDQFARHRLRQKRIRRARIGEQRAQRSIV